MTSNRAEQPGAETTTGLGVPLTNEPNIHVLVWGRKPDCPDKINAWRKGPLLGFDLPAALPTVCSLNLKSQLRCQGTEQLTSNGCPFQLSVFADGVCVFVKCHRQTEVLRGSPGSRRGSHGSTKWLTSESETSNCNSSVGSAVEKLRSQLQLSERQPSWKPRITSQRVFGGAVLAPCLRNADHLTGPGFNQRSGTICYVSGMTLNDHHTRFQFNICKIIRVTDSFDDHFQWVNFKK